MTAKRGGGYAAQIVLREITIVLLSRPCLHSCFRYVDERFMAKTNKKPKMAILVGGGPAPGINGVISSATIEGVKQGFDVVGFRDGFKWLAQGDATHWVALGIDDVTGVHARGGSILGTSRTNPAKSEESMNHVLAVFRRLGIKALVTIGGDDTGFSASNVHRKAAGAIRVAHVPKTIDNDLPLPGSTPTFGFETARHLETRVVRYLAEGCKTTQRWYLIVSMGAGGWPSRPGD